MNIYSILKIEVNKLLEEEFGLNVSNDLQSVSIELPKDTSYGELSTNAAMVLAKPLKLNPRAIASTIQEGLVKHPDVQDVSIAGPGFVNITLHCSFWQRQILFILEYGRGYGNCKIGEGKAINIEYVSANPTGPMHIGHARGAVVGDSLSLLLLKAGYSVTKEYYINDAGAQTDILARSAYLRYLEACGEYVGEIPAGLYPGDYLVGVGEGLKYQFGNRLLEADETVWLPAVRHFAVDAMMSLIRRDLADLGIYHDVFTSERSLHEHGEIPAALQELEQAGMLYRGVLEAPKGKVPDDWEAREQLLFRSSAHGDDSDRPLAKSDGSYTYFAADAAYTRHKLRRNFNQLVMVLGADHGGYVHRMRALVKVLSKGAASLEVILCQLVKLYENGQPFKMSKRAGTFVTVRDVLDVVGRDVLRFVMLTRKPEQPLDFDLVKVQEQSKDNPVFYVHYAHARCRSILRQPQAAKALALAASRDEALVKRLTQPEEISLIRKMCYWPRLVEAAATAFEPHRVAYYLHELAAELHSFWNIGNDRPELRFIVADDMELTAARLMLAEAVATVIASGLQVLGVEPLEEMR